MRLIVGLLLVVVSGAYGALVAQAPAAPAAPATAQAKPAPETITLPVVDFDALQARADLVVGLQAQIRKLRADLVVAQAANAKLSEEIVGVQDQIAASRQTRAEAPKAAAPKADPPKASPPK